MKQKSITNFKVCIKCMTFNHAHYIEDAMNGFCIQQTNFPFVAIIMDDASTDGESEVIKQYLQEHFDLEDKNTVRNEETDNYLMTFARHKENHNCFFAVYLLKYNHYSIKKDKKPYYKEFFEKIKYVTLCEGDDYWTHPMKLQMQVDFLDSQDTCHFCYCKAYRYIQKNEKTEGIWGGKISTLDQALVSENVIPTFTICYSKQYWKKYIDEISPSDKGWRLGDLPLFLWFAANGGIHYLDIFVGIYRVLEESASHSKSPVKTEAFLKDVMNIKLLFDERYNDSKRQKEIQDIFSRKFMNLYAYTFLSANQLFVAFQSINKKNICDLFYLLRGLVYIIANYGK